MTQQPFAPPTYHKMAFNCSFCNAFADQRWLLAKSRNSRGGIEDNVSEVEFCFCAHCNQYSIWFDETMIHPDSSGIAPPNSDLEEDIQTDYREAAAILQKSPRGAAALLRLALQKLCIQLGENGKNINTDIANLVKNGLSPTIQQSLDSLRVVGNESVHPGQIDLRDDPAIARVLFKLINKIAETMITEPREIQEIYSKIPDDKKQAIDKRDSKT